MKRTDLRRQLLGTTGMTMTTAVLESPCSYRLHSEAALPMRRPQGGKPGTTPENGEQGLLHAIAWVPTAQVTVEAGPSFLPLCLWSAEPPVLAYLPVTSVSGKIPWARPLATFSLQVWLACWSCCSRHLKRCCLCSRLGSGALV